MQVTWPHSPCVALTKILFSLNRVKKIYKFYVEGEIINTDCFTFFIKNYVFSDFPSVLFKNINRHMVICCLH